MALADHYKRQCQWRDWRTPLEALPDLKGKSVLDLGCGVGDQAALLVERGARVVGVDMVAEVLDTARARALPGTRFVEADLKNLPDIDSLGGPFDGLWSSFTAAYFVDLAPVLRSWLSNVRPGGWVALTEVDDFFGHQPLAPRTRALLSSYADDARAAGRYDFHMGRKLRGVMTACGIEVVDLFNLNDAELSFAGRGLPDVVAAWATRFGWMSLLKTHCGAEFDAVRDDFLACLARHDHHSLCRVVCCVGRC